MGLQISPLTLALLLFLVAPVLAIVVMSLYKFTGFMTVPELTIANYIKIFSKHLTLSNYLTTAKMVGITWLVSVILGFSPTQEKVDDVIEAHPDCTSATYRAPYDLLQTTPRGVRAANRRRRRR